MFPAALGAAVLLVTRRAFPLTPLVYWLVLAHCIVLMVGGHYTYANVPLFDSIAEAMGHTRNNYDKLGHIMQGLVPALIARELLIRKRVVPSPRWRDFFIVCFCLAFSAFFEMLEWWAALVSETAGDDFLVSQGYGWDTQSDMALAGVGAIAALLVFRRLHDRQLDARSHAQG